MTRSLEEIEKALLAARQEHQDAIETSRSAGAVASDLRARAIAGDNSVSAAQLAAAEDSARFSGLGVPAKLTAIQALEAKHLVVTTELWADEVAATEPALRADVEHAFDALEAVLDQLVSTWRLHGQFVHNTAVDVGSVVSADVTPRVRRAASGVVVDGAQIRPVPVHERLQKMAETAHQRLFAGNPKAQV
jgi:hypothetical protein